MKYYLDSNIFIYTAIYSGGKTEKAFSILEQIGKGIDSAITSSLTLDEFLWKVMKQRSRSETLELAKGIYRYPNLDIVEVKAIDVFSAILLMEKYEKLKPRDAIHAAVAISAGVSQIYSDDPDFDEIKDIKREKL